MKRPKLLYDHKLYCSQTRKIEPLIVQRVVETVVFFLFCVRLVELDELA